jgi:putative heme-binding domain-containing protein
MLPEAGLKVAIQLAKRAEPDDPHVPMLIWWAIEQHFSFAWSELTDELSLPPQWDLPLVKNVLVERLARRAVAEDASRSRRSGNYPPFLLTGHLWEVVGDSAYSAFLRGLDQAFEGMQFDRMPTAFVSSIDRTANGEAETLLFRLRVRFNHGDALKEAHARLADPKRPDADKEKLLQLLGQVRRAESLPVLMALFRDGKSDKLRAAALTAAQAYGNAKVNDELLAAFSKLTGTLRQQALGILLSRPTTALAVLEQVEAKTLDPKSIPTEQLRPVLDFRNEKIDQLVLKHWGKIGAATPGEKQARIAWLRAELGRGAGNANQGKELFTKHCAACHKLFNEGGKVGPDLTTSDRKNRDYLLTHIVDPSLYVRPEFIAHNVTTLDGRRLSGLVAESTEAAVTLINVVENKEVKTTISKKDIDDIAPSAVSLMPDKLLDTLSYQDVRDLFAYMQLPDAKPAAPAKDNPKDAPRPPKMLTVLLISGSLEYKSDESLAAFEKHLQQNFPVNCVRAFRKADDDLPGLEWLDKCDVAVFYTRRLKITGDQLERVKKYVTSGKPIVAIRTASHGFQNWLDMDKEVLGGDYKGHHGHDQRPEIKLTEAGQKHPVLAGVKPFTGTGGLYKNPNVAKDVTVLMTGSIPKYSDPVTWVREYKGGRVFYTSLGHPDDFKDENFVRMLTNAIFWTAKKDVPK